MRPGMSPSGRPPSQQSTTFTSDSHRVLRRLPSACDSAFLLNSWSGCLRGTLPASLYGCSKDGKKNLTRTGPSYRRTTPPPARSPQNSQLRSSAHRTVGAPAKRYCCWRRSRNGNDVIPLAARAIWRPTSGSLRQPDRHGASALFGGSAMACPSAFVRAGWTCAALASAVVTACGTSMIGIMDRDTFAAAGGSASANTTALSAPDTVFGPRVFTRSTGEPQTDTQEFHIRGFDGPFILHVEQADPGNAVAAAWVYLTGFGCWGRQIFQIRTFTDSRWSSPSPAFSRFGLPGNRKEGSRYGSRALASSLRP